MDDDEIQRELKHLWRAIYSLLWLALLTAFAIGVLAVAGCSGVHVPADAGEDDAGETFAADTACELVAQRDSARAETCGDACPYPAGTSCSFAAVQACLGALDAAAADTCVAWSAELEACAAMGGCR